MPQTNEPPNEETFAVANVSLNESSETSGDVVKTLSAIDLPTLDPAVESAQHAVEKRLREEFDSWCEWRYNEPYRTRLGASVIGEDCTRELWYGFRWVKADKHKGRILRLFQRGNREEPHVFEIMRGIGWQIFDRDPNTGEQIAFSAVGGHYGGSVDAVGIAPDRYQLGGRPVLISVKTSLTGATFKKYLDEPMNLASPRYWAQEHSYGRGLSIDTALWVVVNKNDDDIAFQFKSLNPTYGEQLEQKATRIIFSQEPPDRISKSPAFKKCSMCSYKGICHAGNEIDRNCRSCINAAPMSEPDPVTGKGRWFCQVHTDVIPLEVIPNGCESWHPITKPQT